jgi:hypothetical protein
MDEELRPQLNLKKPDPAIVQKIFDKVVESKPIMLSGTPMISDNTEIDVLMRLLNGDTCAFVPEKYLFSKHNFEIESDIQIIMQQTGVDHDTAKYALIRNKGDMIDTIIELM